MFSVHFPCNRNYTFIELLLKMLIFMIIFVNYITINNKVFHFLNMFLSLSLEKVFIFLVKFLPFYNSVLNHVHTGFKD